MSRLVIFGANGQVGRALFAQATRQGVRQVIALDRLTANLENPAQIATTLSRLDAEQPTAAVINAAAYTAVDLAEKEEVRAHLLNAQSPGVMAQWCATHDIPLVHYSTDYVFDGHGTRPWSEDDATAPLSAYGRTKLAGEREIVAAGGRHLIFRTSWVYDEQGKNFLRTMLRLGREREELSVVADQHGAPTFAGHLAQATLKALDAALRQTPFSTGIYHLCNAGETTWHGFATTIFEAARAKGIDLKVRSVQAIPSSAYPTPARRPANSRLCLAKAREVLGVEMPDWRVGLKDCMEILK